MRSVWFVRALHYGRCTIVITTICTELVSNTICLILKFRGKKEKVRCIVFHIFRHYLFELRQKERNELRLVVELKRKENKILKHETTPPTLTSRCLPVLVFIFYGFNRWLDLRTLCFGFWKTKCHNHL